LQLFGILPCLFGGRNIRLGNYFNQRNTAAVIVNIGIPVLMDELSGIFLDMNAVMPIRLPLSSSI